MSNEIEQRLDLLAQLEEETARIEQDREQAVDEMIDPETRAAIAKIKTEFAAKISAVQEQITILKKEIEPMVVAGGETVRGKFKMAVYMKPRESWNLEMVKGYLKAQKQRIKDYMTLGKPSVQFRNIKQGEGE